MTGKGAMPSKGRTIRRKTIASILVALLATGVLATAVFFTVKALLPKQKLVTMPKAKTVAQGPLSLSTPTTSLATTPSASATDAAPKAEKNTSASKSQSKPKKKKKNKAQPKTVASLPSSNALAGKVIVIDPGHQAHGDSSTEPIGPGSKERKAKVTTGTSGKVSGPESNVVLAVGKKLRGELKNQGATVYMTRTTENINISNSERADIANSHDADLFIRLHCDGIGDSSVKGITMLVPSSNKWTKPIVSASKSAGNAVQKAVIAATGARNRGVVSRGDLSGFNYCKTPSILIEMGFMTNPTEDRELAGSNYRQKLVNGMAKGIVAALE